MIRNTANDILKLLKNGTGLDKHKVFNSPDRDIQKIISIILNECRCSMADRNGSLQKEESNADIIKIRNVIMTFLSDMNELQEELVLSVLTKDEIIGPFIKLKFTKSYDKDFEKFDIQIDEPFEKDFKYILGCDDDNIKERVLEQIINPYIKNLIHSDRTLSGRDKVGAFFDKNFGKRKDTNELVEEYKKIIREISSMGEEKIDNTANYILKNIMENRYFKNEIIKNAIKDTDLQILGRKYVTFNNLVNSMTNDTYEMLIKKESPNKQINEIKQIYHDIITQLLILSTNFRELTKSKIEAQIKQINKGISSNLYENNKRYVNLETGYRNIDISIDKNNHEIKFVKHEDIEQAMKGLCSSIKKLLKEGENLENGYFVKEVTRISYRLVRINPFIDGNIRTSKAVVNILLQDRDIVSYFDKEEKDEYINAINKAHLLIAENSKIEKEYMKNLVTSPEKCREIEDKFLSMWI